MKKYIISMLVVIMFATATQAQVPVITTQPQSAAVCVGSKVTFSIAATNNPTSVLWEFSLNDGETWSDISTANWCVEERLNTHIDIEPLSGTTVNGHKTSPILIHAIAINASGSSLPSNAAQLIINSATDSLFIVKPNSTATCVGNSFMLVGSQANGVFSSSNSNVASINCSGLVNVKAQGTANVSYVYTGTNGCTDTANYTVNSMPPTVASITGASSLCVGSNAAYSCTTPKGVWSIVNNRATITEVGVATGSSAGTTNVVYTVVGANGCKGMSSLPVTVSALPLTPNIAYAAGTNISSIRSGANFCKNKTFTLTGNPAGGVWSSSNNSVVTVSNIGFVSTVNNGTGSISYTFTNANGCSSTRTITGNVVTCSSKGREESLVNSQWLLYPNPARSFFNLKVETLIGAGSVVVTDLYGKQLTQQTLSIGINTIDVSKFAKGMYLMSVVTEQGKETRKLVLE